MRDADHRCRLSRAYSLVAAAIAARAVRGA